LSATAHTCRLSTDAAQVARLHALSFDEHWSEDSAARLLAGPGVFALLSEGSNGHPDGFILCRLVLDEMEVVSIATHADHRRKGVASALLGSALERAAASGARRVFLEVAEDNLAARGLYARWAFRVVGERPGYYRRPHGSAHALVLTLSLG